MPGSIVREIFAEARPRIVRARAWPRERLRRVPVRCPFCRHRHDVTMAPDWDVSGPYTCTRRGRTLVVVRARGS